MRFSYLPAGTSARTPPRRVRSGSLLPSARRSASSTNRTRRRMLWKTTTPSSKLPATDSRLSISRSYRVRTASGTARDLVSSPCRRTPAVEATTSLPSLPAIGCKTSLSYVVSLIFFLYKKATSSLVMPTYHWSTPSCSQSWLGASLGDGHGGHCGRVG